MSSVVRDNLPDFAAIFRWYRARYNTRIKNDAADVPNQGNRREGMEGWRDDRTRILAHRLDVSADGRQSENG